MTFSAQGEGRVLRQLNGAPRNFRLGLMAASNQVGKMLTKHTKDGMTGGPQSGRAYNHPRGGSYQASAPGEYPSVVTGQLLNSIDYEVSGARFLRFGTRGAHNRGFDYARGVHEGTSKMASRPYLTKTVDAKSGEILNRLGSVTWRKIIGG